MAFAYRVLSLLQKEFQKMSINQVYKNRRITYKKILMQGGGENTISRLKQNGISALAFSKNGAYCAIALKKNLTILIYEIKTFNDINSWKLFQQIKEHTQSISDIDWAVDQKILTVSHDRSVFVWKKNNQKWEKMLVNIDVRLSVMACKWAPNCKKFALAALPNSLIIGYYNPELKGWVASVKDKIVNNPIVSIDFHASGNLIALGTLDGSVKIVSCNFRNFPDQTVQKLKIDDFPYSGPFQKVETFGQTLCSIDNVLPNMKIWINHVSFENNGKNLLVLTHSNHIKWYDVVQKQLILANQRDIPHKSLPFANGLFNTQKQQLVLGGFDRKVSVFSQSGNNWKFDKFLDNNELTNALKSRGLVTSMLKGIEKKEWSFGDHPKPEQHLNTVKVVRTRGSYVSFDLNGVVHFWK